MILIGYSGHALVAAGILLLIDKPVSAYCDFEEKSSNPLHINYLGSERDNTVWANIRTKEFFIAVGDNNLRNQIAMEFEKQNKSPITIVHPSSVIDPTATISDNGVMISAGVVINAFSTIKDGVIVNTSSVVEHECVVNEYAHIGPGAILCGNVLVGEKSFVGAGAVIKQNIIIGKNVTIGAGAVVIKNVEDNTRVAGNPAREI